MTYAILDTGETLRCAESLAVLEKTLSHDPRFYRCHKAYLVNMDAIERVADVFLLSDDSWVPYRIREKKKITDDYYRYFLGRNLAFPSRPQEPVRKDQADCYETENVLDPRGSSILRECLTKGNKQKNCHCEPVTGVTGPR